MWAKAGWNAVEESGRFTSDFTEGSNLNQRPPAAFPLTNLTSCDRIFRLRSAHLSTSAPLKMTRTRDAQDFSHLLL